MLDKRKEFCKHKGCINSAVINNLCNWHSGGVYDPFTKKYAYRHSDLSTTENLDKALKQDDNKIRMELLSPIAIEQISRVLTHGAKKYSDHNWRKGFQWSRLLGAALRHLMAFMGGQDKDPETGLSHLAHLGATVMFLLEHEVTHKDKDDRYKSPEQTCDNDNEGEENGF